MKWSAAVPLAIVLLLLPGDARAERANAPSDATVFIRLVGSVHVEVDDTAIGGGRRTADIDHIEIGSGSGFVVSPYGYVLTNDHVIANGEWRLARPGGGAKIAVTISRIDVCFGQNALAAYGLPSQCTQASVAASDPALDLALLFVSGTNFPYVALGDSDAVTAGLTVDTLGYPLGRDVEVGKIALAPELVPEITTPIVIWQRSLPVPAGWIAEASGPSPCAGLRPPETVATWFPAADTTITMRVALWPRSDIHPESAASSCSSRRGSAGTTSYASRATFLGVSYVIEGVFASIDPGQVIQLEVVAPDQKGEFARGLLAAWLTKTAKQ
jgi:Trypsin-like peptidase domain